LASLPAGRSGHLCCGGRSRSIPGCRLLRRRGGRRPGPSTGRCRAGDEAAGLLIVLAGSRSWSPLALRSRSRILRAASPPPLRRPIRATSSRPVDAATSRPVGVTTGLGGVLRRDHCFAHCPADSPFPILPLESVGHLWVSLAHAEQGGTRCRLAAISRLLSAISAVGLVSAEPTAAYGAVSFQNSCG
jgi:hypothetical protein